MTHTRFTALAFALVLGAAACGDNSKSSTTDGGSFPQDGVADTGGNTSETGVDGNAGPDGGVGAVDGTAGASEGGADKAVGEDGGATPADGGTKDVALDAVADMGIDAAAGTDSGLDGNESLAADAVSPVAGECNTVVNAAPEITEQWAAGSLPEPQGGQLQNGTYYLTAAELYETGHEAGPNGDRKKKTFVISGVGTSTIQVLIVGYDDDRVVQRISGTAQIVATGGAAPTRLLLVSSCPTATSLNTGYTVQDDTLYLLMNAGGEKTRLTLKRQ